MKDCESLISIGLPVYNGEPFLTQSLDTLLAQDYKNFELLISDNASTDRTGQICREYAQREPRIQYYRNAENLGPRANYNGLLARAKGEYFIWAAHDDLYEPSFISTLARLLDENPDAVLAFSGFNSVDVNGRELRTIPHIFELPADDLCRRLNNFLAQHEYLGKANLICGLMRRQVIQQEGGAKLWGRGEWGADMLIVFRLLSLGKLVISADTLFHKRNALSTGQQIPPPELVMAGLEYSTIREQWGYFLGYRYLINLVESLSLIERMKLRTTRWRRLSRILWYGVRDQFIFPFLRRVAGHANWVRLGLKRRIKLVVLSARRLF